MQKMIELQNYDDAILQLDSRASDTTLAALALPLSHSFSAKMKQLRMEETNLRKHLTFIVETYGMFFHVNRVPSDLEMIAQAIAEDQKRGSCSKVRVMTVSGLSELQLVRSWQIYREKGWPEVSHVHRSEEQLAVFMKNVVEDQSKSKSADYFLPLRDYFYVWLQCSYADPAAACSTACSILVALESYADKSAYAQIAAQALENSEDVMSALKYRYLAFIHALFVAQYNALKASDSAALLDPHAVLSQW
jgi:hypothetical protein